MFGVIKRMFGRSANDASTGGIFNLASKATAKSRLQVVLVQDRTGLSADEMARFKKEMVAVIDKYFEIEKDGFDISYQRNADSSTLLINSPVVVRRKFAGNKAEVTQEKKEESKETQEGTSQSVAVGS